MLRMKPMDSISKRVRSTLSAVLKGELTTLLALHIKFTLLQLPCLLLISAKSQHLEYMLLKRHPDESDHQRNPEFWFKGNLPPSSNSARSTNGDVPRIALQLSTHLLIELPQPLSFLVFGDVIVKVVRGELQDSRLHTVQFLEYVLVVRQISKRLPLIEDDLVSIANLVALTLRRIRIPGIAGAWRLETIGWFIGLGGGLCCWCALRG